MLELLGLAGDPFAEGIFARCGVRERRLELTPDTVGQTLQARTAESEERLTRLAVEAIDQLDFDPAEIGVVVSASYFSLGGPHLSHRLADCYDFSSHADKYHLVGVGCASAVPLFRLAGQALRDRRGEKALVVAAESVSGFLTRVLPDDPKAKVVGSALFADGCAAALLERDCSAPGPAPGPAIMASAVHQVPGSLDHVRFGVTAADSYLQIARELPDVAAEVIGPKVDEFLAREGLPREAVDHWLVHPGGRGVIEGVQRGLSLSDEQVAMSAEVLSQFGNMGTPASFFVLAQTLAERCPAPGEHGLMVTIGPGVTVGLMLLAW